MNINLSKMVQKSRDVSGTNVEILEKIAICHAPHGRLLHFWSVIAIVRRKSKVASHELHASCGMPAPEFRRALGAKLLSELGS